MRKILLAISILSLLQTGVAEDKKTTPSPAVVVLARAARGTAFDRAVKPKAVAPAVGTCTAVVLNVDPSRGEVVVCTQGISRARLDSGQMKRANRTNF